MKEASHGAEESLLWPSQAALRQSLLDQLGLPANRLVRFSAALRHTEAPMVQVDYAVKVPKGQHLALRQQLGSARWRMAEGLPRPWNQARLQQQPPGFIKAPSRAPGMDLVAPQSYFVGLFSSEDLVERCLSRLTGTRELEDEERMQQMHREAGERRGPSSGFPT